MPGEDLHAAPVGTVYNTTAAAAHFGMQEHASVLGQQQTKRDEQERRQLLNQTWLRHKAAVRVGRATAVAVTRYYVTPTVVRVGWRRGRLGAVA